MASLGFTHEGLLGSFGEIDNHRYLSTNGTVVKFSASPEVMIATRLFFVAAARGRALSTPLGLTFNRDGTAV
jgi:hypothetical protein